MRNRILHAMRTLALFSVCLMLFVTAAVPAFAESGAGAGVVATHATLPQPQEKAKDKKDVPIVPEAELKRRGR